MELKELTEVMVRSLVKNKEQVSVMEEQLEDGSIFQLIKVSDEDIGRVIGKDGRVIHSIRTLIQEASFLRDNKYIKVEIEKF